MAAEHAGKPPDQRPLMPTPDHPPYATMVGHAIKSLLEEEEGSTEAAISQFIQSNYSGLPPNHDKLLTYYLNKFTAAGLFVTGVNGRYLLPEGPALPLPPFSLRGTISEPPPILGNAGGVEEFIQPLQCIPPPYDDGEENPIEIHDHGKENPIEIHHDDDEQGFTVPQSKPTTGDGTDHLVQDGAINDEIDHDLSTGNGNSASEPKRRPGRPPGSRNKWPTRRDKTSRRPGRPPGSRNKTGIGNFALMPRRRDRPLPRSNPDLKDTSQVDLDLAVGDQDGHQPEAAPSLVDGTGDGNHGRQPGSKHDSAQKSTSCEEPKPVDEAGAGDDSSASVLKCRGRPPKRKVGDDSSTSMPPKRPRGRPPKPKRGPGRPPKPKQESASKENDYDELKQLALMPIDKRRGRPPKGKIVGVTFWFFEEIP